MKSKINRKFRKWLALSLTAMLMVSVLPWSAGVVVASEVLDTPKETESAEEAAENEEAGTETAEDSEAKPTEQEAGKDDLETGNSETGKDASKEENSETGKDIPKEGDSETAEEPGVSEIETGEETQKENTEESTENTEESAEDVEKDIEDVEEGQEEDAVENVPGTEEILRAEAEGEPMPYADDIIASGSDTSGNITWTLDSNGKLTVNGSGDFTSSLWNSYRESVTSVEVNVTGLTSTDRMFYECGNLESVDLSGSNTGNVTDMSYMFYDCSNLTSVNLSGIDTGNVTNMAGMFRGCSSLVNLDLSGLNTTNLTDMSVMFSACSSLTNLNLSGFNTRRVTRMGELFTGCSSLTSLDLSGFDTGNVTNMAGMFRGCSSLASLNISGINTGNVTDMSDMFSDCSGLASLDLSGINTGNVRDMSFMFWDCVNLTNLDLSSFNTGNVADMKCMFSGCSNLASLDLSNFDTRNVTNMAGMFQYCDSLVSLAPSNFDTRNVTDMWGMFECCDSLVSLDLSNFDTRNVTNIGCMFYSCDSLTSLDLSNFNTGNVTDIQGMFTDCFSLTNLDLGSFDIENVTDMTRMFENCRSLTELGLSNFDMRNVMIVDNMLSGCDKLTTINAPLNLTQSVETPVVAGAVWRLPDGTEVTELPKNLTNSVVVTRHINPKIITTTTELNMEDVIRIKYVPYSYTVRTDNVDEENKVTFSLEAGELPRGMEIYPATGEIYGVPMEAGEFPITVKASYSNPEYEPSYANLTVIVKENTDGDVYNASDAGYDLIVPVGERASDGSNVFILKQSGDQLFVSAGEFREFIDLWLNGERLVDGVDYTKESGSTRITIRSQTFDNKAYRSGTNTLAMEFRVDGDKSKELRRTAQNFRMDSSQNNNGNGNGSNPGNGNGSNPGSGTGNENRNNSENDISDITDKPAVAPEAESSAEIITYTVVSGDTLWGIAKKFYGSGTYWQKIYADNAAVIRDPSRIYAGQVLTIYLSQKDESIITNQDVTDMKEGYYTVKKDDTLWKISEKVYGRGKNWRKIYDVNRDKIKKPEQIYAGQVLVIPEE